jgi:hypothetical protein
VRSPFYFNLGAGYGNGCTTQLGATSSLGDWLVTSGYGSAGRVAFHGEVGAALAPQLLVGFDLTGLSAFGSAPYGASAAVTLVDYDVVATVFPMVQGLFLRAGAGLSTLSSSAGAPGVGASEVGYLGTNVLLGAGWAFPLAGGPMNVTLGLDWSHQFFGPADVQGSSFWALRLGFGWY